MRRITGMAAIAMMALLLAACGGDDEDDAAETATVAPATTVAATDIPPADVAATEPAAATPDIAASPVSEGTPVGLASPVAPPMASPIASPVASPVIDPLATPVADESAGPVAGVAVASPAADAGDPAGTPETQVLNGLVTLPGTPNERFVIADDGCIGLGNYAGLQAGQQVIVRDQGGTILGVGYLAATGSSVVCSWTFEVEAPVSEFYEVSIPMRVEQVFTREDVASTGGDIEITLP